MNTRRLVLSAVVPLVLCACVYDEAARYYADEKYDERLAEQVEVLFEEPDRPYDGHL
jgi:hypothetical protein